MKIKIELTPAQALALASLADCSAQDIEDVLLSQKSVAAGRRALQILEDAIPNSIRKQVRNRLERSNIKLEKYCNKKKNNNH